MFAIDLRSRVPIYEQIEQNIIKLISTGVLNPDEQLPGVRTLARELGINPNTVQKAYSELEAKGFIYQAAGRGSFVSQSDKAAEALKERELQKLYESFCQAKKTGLKEDEILKKLHLAFKED